MKPELIKKIKDQTPPTTPSENLTFSDWLTRTLFKRRLRRLEEEYSEARLLQEEFCTQLIEPDLNSDELTINKTRRLLLRQVKNREKFQKNTRERLRIQFRDKLGDLGTAEKIEELVKEALEAYDSVN